MVRKSEKMFEKCGLSRGLRYHFEDGCGFTDNKPTVVFGPEPTWQPGIQLQRKEGKHAQSVKVRDY